MSRTALVLDTFYVKHWSVLLMMYLYFEHSFLSNYKNCITASFAEKIDAHDLKKNQNRPCLLGSDL